MKSSNNSTRLKRPWKKMRVMNTTGAFTCSSRSIISTACFRSSETCLIWIKVSCLRCFWTRIIGWPRLGLLSMTQKFSLLSAQSMKIRVEHAVPLAKSLQDLPHWLPPQIATHEAMETTTTLSRQTNTTAIFRSRLTSVNSSQQRSSISRLLLLRIHKLSTRFISATNYNT